MPKLDVLMSNSLLLDWLEMFTMDNTFVILTLLYFVSLFFKRGGRNVEFQNVDRPKISERRKCVLSWSERRNQNVKNVFWVDQNVEKRIITTSKRVDHYYKNQNVEKNVESRKTTFDVLINLNAIGKIITSKV